MSRTILILTMISSLLACPLDCMSGSEPAEGATVTAGRCPCCHHDGTDPELPPTRPPEGACCDCICDGAVRVDAVIVAPDDLSSVAVVVRFDTATASGFGLAKRDDAAEAGARWIRPGRAMRLAIHSLQI